MYFFFSKGRIVLVIDSVMGIKVLSLVFFRIVLIVWSRFMLGYIFFSGSFYIINDVGE